MDAINKRTGSPIVGTFERLTGKSPVSFDGRKDEDGRPAWEHLGGTDIFWDDARTETTDDGQAVFLDENGHEVPHDQVEVVTAYTLSPSDEHTVWCADCVTRHHKQVHRPVGMTEARGRTCAECGGAADTPEPAPGPKV